MAAWHRRFLHHQLTNPPLNRALSSQSHPRFTARNIRWERIFASLNTTSRLNGTVDRLLQPQNDSRIFKHLSTNTVFALHFFFFFFFSMRNRGEGLQGFTRQPSAFSLVGNWATVHNYYLNHGFTSRHFGFSSPCS